MRCTEHDENTNRRKWLQCSVRTVLVHVRWSDWVCFIASLLSLSLSLSQFNFSVNWVFVRAEKEAKNPSSSWFYWNENTLSRALNAISNRCVCVFISERACGWNMSPFVQYLKWTFRTTYCDSSEFHLELAMIHIPSASKPNHFFSNSSLNFIQNVELHRYFSHFNLINAVDILRFFSASPFIRNSKRNEHYSNFPLFLLPFCNCR